MNVVPLHEVQGGPYARVLKDSVSQEGDRVTTLEVKLHRMVAEQFLTHRVFSRSAASSRAIPVAKMIQRVLDDPAVPVWWGANQPGMQARAELEGDALDKATRAWHRARRVAVANAELLADLGLHKQLASRGLHAYQWQVYIVTATDWDGFWAQRLHDAQPEMRAAAEVMRGAMVASSPQELGQHQWHAPFVDGVLEWERPPDAVIHDRLNDIPDSLQLSVARCARVSYLGHNGVVDIDKDLELYEKLVTAVPMHASPLEHVCTPEVSASWSSVAPHLGNLRGWEQLRHVVEA